MEGLLAAPLFYQVVLGRRWGLPSDVETILYPKRLLPAGAMWAAVGIGPQQMPMVAQSVLLGEHRRWDSKTICISIARAHR